MTALSAAIERGQWELAALRLLVGVTEAAAALPPDAVEGLLDVLSGLEDGRERGRRGRGTGGTGRGRRR